jgi:Golgi phosphoprotein 3
MLNIYEEVFLLTLHEDKIVPTSSTMDGFPYWLEAAFLIDLALMQRITSEAKHRLKLLSPEPTGEALLDSVLEQIQGVEQTKKFSYWMVNLEYKSKKTFQQIAEQLVQKGVLRQEDDDFTWVIPYPADNPHQASAKFFLRRCLRGLVLAREKPNLSELGLLSLLQSSNKMDLLFFKDERKLVRRMIDEDMMTKALQDPTGQTIQEINSAMVAHIDED